MMWTFENRKTGILNDLVHIDYRQDEKLVSPARLYEERDYPKLTADENLCWLFYMTISSILINLIWN